MTRLLLIFAIVCTGLTPGATCLQAAASAGAPVVVEACAMSCCGLTCCCVAQDTPATPVPEVPAMPSRGIDLLPTVLLASPFELAWGDAPTHPRLEAAASFNAWPLPRAVQPMICRWLT